MYLWNRLQPKNEKREKKWKTKFRPSQVGPWGVFRGLQMARSVLSWDSDVLCSPSTGNHAAATLSSSRGQQYAAPPTPPPELLLSWMPPSHDPLPLTAQLPALAHVPPWSSQDNFQKRGTQCKNYHHAPSTCLVTSVLHLKLHQCHISAPSWMFC